MAEVKIMKIIDERHCPKCKNPMATRWVTWEVSSASGDALQGGIIEFCPTCEKRLEEQFQAAVEYVRTQKDQKVSIEITISKRKGETFSTETKIVEGSPSEIWEKYLSRAYGWGVLSSSYTETRGYPPMKPDYIESYEERIITIICGDQVIYRFTDYNVQRR